MIGDRRAMLPKMAFLRGTADRRNANVMLSIILKERAYDPRI